MQHRTLSWALGALAMLATEAPLTAHGGIYRGPGDVVPPAPGGGRTGRPTGPVGPSGPQTGRPGAPTAPTPTGPSPTGGARPSGTGSSPAGSTPRGWRITEDLTDWTFWWEFNKHAYLGLRAAVHAAPTTTGLEEWWLGPTRKQEPQDLLEPTRTQIVDEILPTLKRAIDSTEQRDIVSSCLIAMAKIGTDHPEFTLADVFRPRLSRDNQEVRETAALAFGIAAVPSGGALDVLCDLALDTPAGRKLRGRELDVRTRAFALYGLGLFANEHRDVGVKRRALATCREVLESEAWQDRNLKIAAIHGIGMLAFDRKDPASDATLRAAVDALLRYYELDLGVAGQINQAHCPTAITKLLGRDHARSDEFRQRFAEELDGDNRRRRSADLKRSCALALGQLCRPRDDERSLDAGYSELLERIWTGHKDAQTRSFALLALGQIGGRENRQVLLRALRHGNKVLERPWAALALGVMARAATTRARESGASPEPDRLIGEALLEQLRAAQAPTLVGALGVALGLVGHVDAAPELEARIRDEPHKEQQAGYLCIGLGLMKHRRSVETIRATMLAATRRPQLFVQAAIALGVLGDKSAAEVLHDKLADEGSNLATLAAIAGALGQIGDRRSVTPLTDVLFDERRGDLQRAFAAVGLGAVADRAMLPWHAEISTNANYRAAVETLTNGQSGVLDIL